MSADGAPALRLASSAANTAGRCAPGRAGAPAARAGPSAHVGCMTRGGAASAPSSRHIVSSSPAHPGRSPAQRGKSGCASDCLAVQPYRAKTAMNFGAVTLRHWLRAPSRTRRPSLAFLDHSGVQQRRAPTPTPSDMPKGTATRRTSPMPRRFPSSAPSDRWTRAACAATRELHRAAG